MELTLRYGCAGTSCNVFFCLLMLCSRLADHSDRRHVALKIGAYDEVSRELLVLKYLKTCRTGHVGRKLIRELIDEFEVVKDDKKYRAVIHPPLSTSVQDYRKLLRGGSLPPVLFRSLLKHIFIALDYLHTEAKVIHTGTSSQSFTY